MTLDTRVVIKNPDVHPQAVMAFINRELLCAPDAEPLEWPPAHLSPEYLAEHYAGVTKIGNWLGQGLSALTDITYRDPAGLIVADYMSGWETDGSPDPDYDDDELRTDKQLVTGSMVVSFDTAYGYREGQAGCDDLHAYFVTRLAEEYGPVAWLNEFTGEWHPLTSPEDFVSLLAFGNPTVGSDAVQLRAAGVSS